MSLAHMILTNRILLATTFLISVSAGYAVADGTCALSLSSIAGVKDGDTKGKTDLIPELEEQLGSLPFKRYRILESAERQLRGKQELRLTLTGCTGEKHSLLIVPERRTKQGVLFTVNWNGANGESLLATRLNLISGRMLFVGTEETAEESTVLGMKLNCD